MCQGVIVSIVKFKTKSGRRKHVVLSGIGSHSNMLLRNQKKLVRAGCDINSADCSVLSAESDFSGNKYGRYTVESGDPTKQDLAILTREFKRCSGSARSLIAHVRSVGKIDDALLALLRQPARAEYEKVRQPAWAEYEKVRQTARAEYEKVRQPAWVRLFSKPKNRSF